MKKLAATLLLTVAGALCLCGAGEAEELARLRRENAELREQLLKARAKLRDQSLFLAAAADEGEFSSPKEREARLLTRLSVLCSDGEKLAIKAAEAVSELRGILRELHLDTARRAQVQLTLDELERQAGIFAALVSDPAADPAEIFRSCRVLAVNSELGILLMDIGFRQGAFVGLTLRGGDGSKLKIRLEDVRSGVSAALVIEGSLADVVPGMVFNAETRVRRPGGKTQSGLRRKSGK